MEVIDYEGEIKLLFNLKYIVIVVEPASPNQNTPHYTELVFCETIVWYYQHNTEAATYNYFLHYNAASGLSIYFYRNLVVLIPPQNMFKMCPHISGLENIAFPKSDMGIL